MHLKHQEAIDKLYKENNVGTTISEKLSFWQIFTPNETHYHGTSPIEKVLVSAYEMSWVINHFPDDFKEMKL